MGGLGLRSAEEHGPAAYASSYISAQPLLRSLRHIPEDSPSVPLPPALLQSLALRRREDTNMESLVKMEGGQRALSLEIDLAAAEELKSQVTALGGVEGGRENARLACLGQPYAGAWLNVVPSPPLGLHLRASEFVPALKLRLGMDVFSTAGPCPACGSHSDKLGDHALCCATDGSRIGRHNALRDALHATAVSAGIGATKESSHLLPGSGRKPADVFLPYWTGGKDTAWDVTVVHPLQSSMVARAATNPGHGAQEAFSRKWKAAGEKCLEEGIVFVPLALESLGGWHEAAIREVKKLGGALARHRGAEESTCIRHLFQRFSVILIKGNSTLVVNRVPDNVPPQIDGLH